jgi:hypothetical protein
MSSSRTSSVLNLSSSPKSVINNRSSSSSPILLNPDVDLQFGHCTELPSIPGSNSGFQPISFRSNLQIDSVDQSSELHSRIVERSSPCPSLTSPSSSSSEDEAVEAKRQKLDPDYVPSTASEGTQTGENSRVTSEKEEEEETEEETETEEDGSWYPSDSTSPEQISSPEDD